MENTETAKYTLSTALHVMIERGLLTKEQIQKCETHHQLQNEIMSIHREDYVLKLLNDLDDPMF